MVSSDAEFKNASVLPRKAYVEEGPKYRDVECIRTCIPFQKHGPSVKPSTGPEGIVVTGEVTTSRRKDCDLGDVWSFVTCSCNLSISLSCVRAPDSGRFRRKNLPESRGQSFRATCCNFATPHAFRRAARAWNIIITSRSASAAKIARSCYLLSFSLRRQLL